MYNYSLSSLLIDHQSSPFRQRGVWKNWCDLLMNVAYTQTWQANQLINRFIGNNKMDHFEFVRIHRVVVALQTYLGGKITFFGWFFCKRLIIYMQRISSRIFSFMLYSFRVRDDDKKTLRTYLHNKFTCAD